MLETKISVLTDLAIARFFLTTAYMGAYIVIDKGQFNALPFYDRLWQAPFWYLGEGVQEGGWVVEGTLAYN